MADDLPSESGADPAPAEEDEPPRDRSELGHEEGEADADGGEGERRPISVRDLMPEPSPERRRPDPPRPAVPEEDGDDGPETAVVPGAEEGADAADGSEADGEKGAPRPTPVRVAMDAPPPGDSRPVESLPSRTFEARGREWIVRVTGRTITGTRPDAGALLMQLEFSRGEEPDTPVRELLTVDRPLDALYPEDLEELLDRARPATQPLEEGA